MKIRPLLQSMAARLEMWTGRKAMLQSAHLALTMLRSILILRSFLHICRPSFSLESIDTGRLLQSTVAKSVEHT